ncbi:MAG: transcription-repair coupling factor, partial [Bacteroidota bacterium]
MNLPHLLDQYLQSPLVEQLVKRVNYAEAQQLYLKNLQGSSAEFIVSAVFQHEEGKDLNHLIVLNDPEEAAYFHNTLENLTSALDLFYFPSSFKNRKNFRLLNSSHVMLRTEALTKLSGGGNKKIVVTYPEAIFEKVILPGTISSNIISIKTNDTIQPESLMDLFVMYGFERTDFVYEPGQFALRGGILDIYSFGNEKPYRVELFGNEVDSIRIFDPETQLSERKLLQVNIIPNVDVLPETAGADAGEKISLLEFMPENTVFWLKDWDVIEEKIKTQESDFEAFLQLQSEGYFTKQQDEEEQHILKSVSAADFITASNLLPILQQKKLVEFGFKPQLTKEELVFETRPQPAFNRQFELLIKDLKSLEGGGYSIYIFADQVKQLERLHTIFTDLQTEIQFTPIG